MPSYTTVKNTLKKLETRQQETAPPEGCGVIFIDEFEKLQATGRKGRKGGVGYLVVPRPVTLAEWEAEYDR